MKNIRIGNDIVIKWSIYRQGQPEDFSGKNISVSLHEPFTNTKADITYIIEGNVINISFFGKDQKKAGQYTLKLVENEGAINMHTIDHCSPFTLVNKSCMAGGKDDCSNISVESIDLDSDINIPKKGESAYEIALKLGFKGTEEEWIASLKGQNGEKGERGEKGEPGKSFTYNDFTSSQIYSLQQPAINAADTANKAAVRAFEAEKLAEKSALEAFEAAKAANIYANRVRDVTEEEWAAIEENKSWEEGVEYNVYTNEI